jgi:RHS repeat-associated protein
VHALPATRTLNKLRAPTLVYSSAQARPFPLVAANVTLPAAAATPDTVSATLKIGGVTRGTAKWPGSDWTPGSTRRIVVPDTVAGDSTRVYTYSLTVTNQWNGASVLTSPAATIQAGVVSRKLSAFGAGWWLAGLERLVFQDTNLVWVGGDGSIKLYVRAGALWRAQAVDRPDSMTFDGTSYWRYLPHGVKVQFNGAGRHTATIDRLGYQTLFAYKNGTTDTLQTITLPPTGLTYQFTYTSGTRWIVTAPGTPTQTRADTATISSTRLTALAGPYNTRITFAYATGADANLVISRTNRRGFPTMYAYDAGKRLVQARADMGPGQPPILAVWRPLETFGLPTTANGRSVDTALAYVQYEGPRTDVWDTTALWLDRLSAPRRVVNALGYQTVVTRDSVWPALAKQVQGPTGLVSQATFDSHGNVLTVTQVNPLGDGQNAVTTYTWDTVWDFVKTVTLPMGELTQVAYNATNGNRLWQQPGTDSTRRVRFSYNALALPSAVEYPTSPVTRDSMFYDALGNASSAKSPRGVVTYTLKDAVGRDTLTKSPLDTTQLKTVRHRILYDLASRDTLNVSLSDSSSEQVVTRTHYDAESNQDSVLTQSTPDTNHIGWVKHVFTYDRANRKGTEKTVGMNTIPFQYDAAGNPLNGGRQGGAAVAVTYDALDRPTRRVLFQAVNDTVRFTYDTLGNLRTATNATAQIGRQYYPNGALRYDTLRVSTELLTARDFNQHIYVQRFGYDRNGRRTWAIHPTQLGPTTTDSVAYTYESVFGQLASVRDIFGHMYAFRYDSVGRPKRIARLADVVDSVYETLHYDSDGQLSDRVIKTAATTVLAETLSYDSRNNVSRASGNAGGQTLADSLAYTPLGTLVKNYSAIGQELYTQDALGNRARFEHGVNINPEISHYEAGTARLLWREEHYHPSPGNTGLDTMYYAFGGDGLLASTHHVRAIPFQFGGQAQPMDEFRDVISFYDAQQRLIKTQYYLDTLWSDLNRIRYTSEETYRYDPLGRRVYARAVRGPQCQTHDKGSGCFSTVTRTVWDGGQILYEVRVAGDSADNLELDTPSADSAHGVVGYLHAGGVDQPLALWKGLNDLVLPHANYRGAFVVGTCPTAYCSLSWFPAGTWSSFGEPSPLTAPPTWHGSVITGGTDASGYQYKRNRYYDPNSGRFTQEDPIGLAGGLNLYGFADGDPVNFSDPFGLCTDRNGNELPPEQCRDVTFAQGHGIVIAARSISWSWTMDQSVKDLDAQIGDCSDAVESWMRSADLPGGMKATATEKGKTGFSRSTNYRHVDDAEQVHPGDAVVYHGNKHVGVATGKTRTQGGKTQWQVWQNGQSGTGQDWVDRDDAEVYRRQAPK